MDDLDTVDIGGAFEITKVDAPSQNIFGWASVVIEKDGSVVVDRQGDVIDPADLETAAYDFMLESRSSGDMHDGGPVLGQVIESMVLTVEKAEAMGIPPGTVPVGWWLGVHIEDAAQFEKVRSGERPAFSIEGQAIREPVTVEG